MNETGMDKYPKTDRPQVYDDYKHNTGDGSTSAQPSQIVFAVNANDVPDYIANSPLRNTPVDYGE